jgi:hypothetical protein
MSARLHDPAGMRKWQTRAALAAACIFALALALAAAAHALFDGERLAQLARRHARDAWSRELEIGRLTLTLLPAPTLRAERVTLSNPEWAQQARMAQIAALELRIAVLPLLSGRIAPTAISARGVQLDLERAENGRANWEFGSGGGRIDWSRLASVRAEDAQLAYRAGDAPERVLRVDQAQLSAEPGWDRASLAAQLQRNGAALQLDARCSGLARFAGAGSAADCDLRAQAEGARLALAGKIPLSADLRALAARLTLEAPQPAALFAFAGAGGKRVAALALAADLQGSADGIALHAINARLGATELHGQLALRRQQGRLRYDGDIEIPHLDWATLSRDAGRPAPQEPRADELFRRQPLPWEALQALAGSEGRLMLKIGSGKLRSGVGFSQFAAELALRDEQLDIRHYSLRLLGGAAHGALRLDGARRRAQLSLQAQDLLLQRWFAERGRKLPLSGGAMAISAEISGHGDSMAALAATLDGSIDVRGGHTAILSARASEAEKLLTDMLPLFSERDAQQMDLQCFAGRLRFANGRADGSGIVGARSDVSQLLTSGAVDLRRQEVELRGRVRARHGVALGIAVLSSDVRIHGPLRKPAIALDAAGAPGALARLGAAILTGGLSMIATAAWDAANPATDACAAVFRQPRERR